MINSVYHIASGQITANIQESGTPTDESQVSVREGYSVYNGLLDSSNMWIDEGGNPQPRAQIDVTASPYCLLGDTIKLKSKTKGEIWFSHNGLYHTNSDNVILTESGTILLEIAGRYSCATPIEISVKTLNEFKEKWSTDVNNTATTRLESGFQCMETLWDCDEKSQNVLTMYVNSVNSGADLPAGFFWTDHSNAKVPMTKENLVILLQAMTNFLFMIHSHKTELKGLIGAATDLDILVAIDITQSWPS